MCRSVPLLNDTYQYTFSRFKPYDCHYNNRDHKRSRSDTKTFSGLDEYQAHQSILASSGTETVRPWNDGLHVLPWPSQFRKRKALRNSEVYLGRTVPHF